MRAFSNSNLILATIFSTILHFFVLALFDTFPLRPKTITPRSNIFMVDLLPQEKKVTPPKKEMPKREQEEKKKEVKKEEVKKKEVKKKVKKEEVKKKKVEVVTKRTKEKKVDKVRKEKKVEEAKPKIDDEQKRVAAIKQIQRKVAERKMEEAPVTASRMEFYFGMVRERVKRFWVIPDILVEEEGLEAVIVIQIDKDGLVIGSRFERSSGNPYFDQSAMRAIAKAAPFPPPPLRGKPMEIGLVFQPH